MRRELLAIGLAACTSAPVATCPAGTDADAARASAIETRLASVSEGRALLGSRDRVAAICFGDGASVITSDHVVLLARTLEEGEAAARLGHLLVHARDGLPIDVIHAGVSESDCDAAVDRALALEARAYVTEVALQDALHAQPSVLAFEFASDVRTSTPDAREPLVLAYLRAHPTGAPGIEGLAAAYRARCAH